MIGYVDASWLLDVRLGSSGPRHLRDGAPLVSSFVTSELTEVEFARTLRRDGLAGDLSPLVTDALSGIDLLGLHSVVLTVARDLPVPFLKTLDALHVASALLSGVDVILTRDRQMARACEELGLPVP